MEMAKDGVDHPGALGAIVTRKDPATGKMGWFIDHPKDPVTGKPISGKYQVVGGADAADAAREAAATKFTDNRVLAALQAKMADSDFVMPGEPGKEALGLTFDQVFGAGGMHSNGRLLFFGEHLDGRRPKVAGTLDALHPLEALSLPPEKVVMKLYLGDKALPRDRFPTLKSLEASEESSAFKTLTVSPKGAAEMIEKAGLRAASERRRGWIEVKLNSFGFARDENGQVTQLYRTKDDFDAQWKAYDNADRDLKAAILDLATAKAEEASRVEETAIAKTAADERSRTYLAAQGRLRDALRESMLADGLDANAST
ncbi:MAG: hypothetical protein ABL955_16750, partial [Elusimicrobiota bacterium]